jgi:hypothetical protein
MPVATPQSFHRQSAPTNDEIGEGVCCRYRTLLDGLIRNAARSEHRAPHTVNNPSPSSFAGQADVVTISGSSSVGMTRTCILALRDG